MMRAMATNYQSDAELLRAEIAAAAARMIAEDGADYGTAKRKAAKQILGNAKVRGDILPDNAQIEDEVRLYNNLFFADSQPARLAHLRGLALRMMTELTPFNPHLTGAVLNGTAGEHSDIHLQLFAESPKDVEIYLLNKNINFEVSETPHFRGRAEPVETVSFIWQQEGVHLALYEVDDLRGAAKTNAAGRIERADIDTVRALTTMENNIK
jgi:hypothetical protein